MEIVTGDRYLDMLAHFVEDNVAELLDGSRVLKLNPLGLHYLQARLESLQELEQLHSAAPVDYLRAYIADLGDHRALELLRRVLGLLASVKVVSVIQSPARDPTPINLLPFERLRSLELRGCDLSTAAARGLLYLRPYLEKLICHNSTVTCKTGVVSHSFYADESLMRCRKSALGTQDALRHVLAGRMVDISSTQPWSRLAIVSCACNGIPVMDDSLQLLPAVEVLDLRRNRLTHVSNLGQCKQIKFLDLGFNWIQSVSRLDQVSSSLTTLILRFNALSVTRGIENLGLLRHLDVSHNTISNFCELGRFGGLRYLAALWLKGNPVSYARDYRERVLSFFPAPGKLCLDGRRPSRLEEWKVHKLFLRQCRPDGAFGLYAPAAAREDAPGKVPRGRKKISRVAVITSGNTTDVSKLADQALDSAASGGQETQAGEMEVKLERLIKHAQDLKRDKPIMWLANVPDLFAAEKGVTRSDSSLRRKHSKRRRKGAAGETTAHAPPVPAEVLGSNRVLDKLVRKQASASFRASPPHFNKGILERRQKLEQELLQASVGPMDLTDSSTSTSDDGESSTGYLVQDSPSQPKDVFGGAERNPIWVGSSAAPATDENDQVS